MAAAKQSQQIYQLHISLDNIRPPIWRRVLVPSDVKLSELSEIILTAMGWMGYHLHQFIINGVYYGDPENDDMGEMKNETRVALRTIARMEDFKFKYEYDFGDGWMHTIKVEKILAREDGIVYPVCIKGKRACPPEDVGGPWGYEDFLNAIKNPESTEAAEMIEWVGGEFDPEEFDLDDINAQLSSRKTTGGSFGFGS